MRVYKNIQLAVGASLLMSASTCISSPAVAQEQSANLWDTFKSNVSTTWDSDKYELYVPAVTWHNRAMYDKKKTDEYNERPWGLGFGKYRYDEDNDWHAIYAMAFKDSHNDWEPIGGYAFQKCGSQGTLMVFAWELASL